MCSGRGSFHHVFFLTHYSDVWDIDGIKETTFRGGGRISQAAAIRIFIAVVSISVVDTDSCDVGCRCRVS